jgi:hypothetical protein
VNSESGGDVTTIFETCGEYTVTVATLSTVPLVAVIVAVPPATPVTNPCASTWATALLLLAQVTKASVRSRAALSRMRATMNALSPTRSAIEAGASNTAAARGGGGGGATNSTDRSPRQAATAASTTPIVVDLGNLASFRQL